MSNRISAGSVFAFALVGLAACVDAVPETHTYLSTLGSDTIRIESFTYTDSTLVGELVVRSPVTQFIHYHGRIGEDGTMETFTVETSTPPTNPGGPEAVTTVMTFDGNNVSMTVNTPEGENQVDAPQEETAIPSLGQIPFVTSAMAESIRRARLAGADEFPVRLALPGQTGAYSTAVQNASSAEVSMPIFGDPIHISVDENGVIQSVSGRETTMKMETVRLVEETLDLQAMASEYAERDARGEGIGTPSPPATTTAQLDGATISIRYSQPAVRGREIWGELVPYGEVWRTGANAATHITTDRAMQFGEFTLEPGTYTLWSQFQADGQELIINSQVNVWGTAHNGEFDMVSLPMEAEELAESVERFTIGVDDTEAGGTLTLAWDRTRFSVPFVVN